MIHVLLGIRVSFFKQNGFNWVLNVAQVMENFVCPDLKMLT